MKKIWTTHSPSAGWAWLVPGAGFAGAGPGSAIPAPQAPAIKFS